ncbi:MAG: family 20 glycosylhydrolase [Bacteroidetes bacterium]|nr:family 20 glycosylhydrolase [Bacteroidota bacterium]
MPELDMPGHTTAALASYPWLGCAGDSLPVPAEWGMHRTLLCAGRESTYAVIERVLDEVTELFSSPWIHLGGDECPWDAWSNCDSCQTSISRNNLRSIGTLQYLLTQQVEMTAASCCYRYIPSAKT